MPIERCPAFCYASAGNPAKDTRQPAVALSELLTLPVPGEAAAVATWRITPPCEAPLHLFVPLVLVDEHQVIARPEGHARCLVDAFSKGALVRPWMELLFRNGAEGCGAAPLSTGLTTQLARAGLQPDGDSVFRCGNAKQSDTSIRLGGTALPKIARKLEKGIHSEFEVARFLTGEAGFAASPAILGRSERLCSPLCSSTV